MLLPSERARLAACGGECACEACSKKASSQVPVEFSGVKGFINLTGFDGNGKRVAGPMMFDPESHPSRVANNFRQIAKMVDELSSNPRVARVVVGVS